MKRIPLRYPLCLARSKQARRSQIRLAPISALEDEQRRRRAESDRVRYLNDLEDPMSVVSLVGGVI